MICQGDEAAGVVDVKEEVGHAAADDGEGGDPSELDDPGELAEEDFARGGVGHWASGKWVGNIVADGDAGGCGLNGGVQ